MHLTLPSRLAGDVRKIRGVEIAQVAEQADAAGSGDGFSSLLGGCWLDTLDRGPYGDAAFTKASADDAPEKVVWTRVLKGDLLAGVVGLRQLSLTVTGPKGEVLEDGDVYEFDVQCAECRKPIQWEVRLSELPVKWLPEASAERIKAGLPFETTIAGKKVLYDLQTLAQEEPVVRLMKQQRRKQGTVVDVLCGQVRSIEGVNPDIKARHRWLNGLGFGELLAAQAAMEEPDCGIDTRIEVVCQNDQCRWQQEVNLPLGRRFFALKRKRRPDPEAETAGDGETPPGRASSGPSSGAPAASGGGASAPTSGGASTGAPATPG